MVVSCLKLLAKKRKNSLTLHNPIDFIESIMKLIKEEMLDQGGLHTRATNIPPLSLIYLLVVHAKALINLSSSKFLTYGNSYTTSKGFLSVRDVPNTSLSSLNIM